MYNVCKPMKKGGVGGNKTTAGLRFESRTGLLELLKNLKNYTVANNWVIFKGKRLGLVLRKSALYKFLAEKGINYLDSISSKLLPDDSIYLPQEKRFIVLEIKFQEVGGSTDEKLQTCDYKLKQYKKLLSSLDPQLTVEYIYILNNWFKQVRYKDVLEYISKIEGCSYYFNEVPLEKLGLPSSGVKE